MRTRIILMTISGLNHQKLAGDIQRLIHDEQYTEAQELLPSFAQAVVEACNGSGQEQDLEGQAVSTVSWLIGRKGPAGSLSRRTG